MNPDPVIHHAELCVHSLTKTMHDMKKYGFRPYLQRTVPGFCRQVVMKLNRVYFIATEKDSSFDTTAAWKGSQRKESLTVLCPGCEDQQTFNAHVDTVFNVCFHVRDVEACVSRVLELGYGIVIKPTDTVSDEYGVVTFAIIKSVCGNVLHTLINKERYYGLFLPGFQSYISQENEVDIKDNNNLINNNVTHIDHVTLCTFTGQSHQILRFYEACFNMKRILISGSSPENTENTEEGLILDDGVGLRLRAMEYWRCSEYGLACSSPASWNSNDRLMMVVVETLPGQRNCNVETFLREHRGPGVEHVALATHNITQTVNSMQQLTVLFRTPPATYYKHLREMPEITEIEGLDLNELERLGILIDRENDIPKEEEEKPKYLMQIFALPLFDRKTFFLEIIQRTGGARGLGAKNVLALVRSIREEEKRKAEKETLKTTIQKETSTTVEENCLPEKGKSMAGEEEYKTEKEKYAEEAEERILRMKEMSISGDRESSSCKDKESSTCKGKESSACKDRERSFCRGRERSSPENKKRSSRKDEVRSIFKDKESLCKEKERSNTEEKYGKEKFHSVVVKKESMKRVDGEQRNTMEEMRKAGGEDSHIGSEPVPSIRTC